MSIVKICNKIIEFSFYAIFFLVPLIFWKDTSELYELNKMWAVFFFAILIAGSWIVKIAVTKKAYIQRTPLDVPIAVFFIGQVLSTVISLDSYVSFWGYYSRFNGGLLSTIVYLFLFYAFLSNFDIKTKAIEVAKKIVWVSLGSSAVVALWGLPSHFGYDPTCFLFRGSLDVSCWTPDFQPKIRMFSTLGQPDWLGAYLTILIPLAVAFTLNAKRKLYAMGFLFLTVIFYIDLVFTKSRSALLGAWVAIAVFGLHYLIVELGLKLKNFNFKKVLTKTIPFSILIFLFLVITAAILSPIQISNGKIQTQKGTDTKAGTFSTGGGGTESGKIRLYVWQGALNAWIHNPIVGTGVETFAFAYYKYKPIGHNLTSEWNYLYNKAHNEYLNYLATSGIIGLGSYLLIIAVFFYSIRKLLTKKTDLLVLALVAGYAGTLVTNFFGFSVVIVNLYFFLIPAFIYILIGKLNFKKTFSFSFDKTKSGLILKTSIIQKIYIVMIILVSTYLILFLRNFWMADRAFSLGQNLARAGDYTNSYYALKEAVARVPFEPTYKDELSSDDAIFSIGLLQNLPKDEKNQTTTVSFAENLAKESITSVDDITKTHPNNVVFWKTKVRVYYILSQIDPKYTKDALDALKKAQTLAPSDPNIYYNLGLLYGQENDFKKAIESLKEAIRVKPNYREAYYALGLFYREEATDKTGKVVSEDLNKQAIGQMQYILDHINPNDKEARAALDAFQK